MREFYLKSIINNGKKILLIEVKSPNINVMRVPHFPHFIRSEHFFVKWSNWSLKWIPRLLMDIYGVSGWFLIASTHY